jgi:hypothetical protein
MKIAIRLVPLATEASNPKNIRAGRVSVEPPPAMMFINPAAAPTPKSNRIDSNSGNVLSNNF